MSDNKVIPFRQNKVMSSSSEEVLMKIYHDTKLSNILHEFIMASDKILRAHGYEFKSEGDRDFVKDIVHKTFVQATSNVIKLKEDPRK